jgi:hypothetical protein
MGKLDRSVMAGSRVGVLQAGPILRCLSRVRSALPEDRKRGGAALD